MSKINRSRTVCAALLTMLLAIVSLAPALLRPVAAVNDDKVANQPKVDYHARRQRLMEQLKDGVIVLIGAREEDLGEVGRFRQKNDFMYLTGVQTPASYMMLVPAGVVPDKPAKETVFIPPRNLMHEKWTGPQVGPGAESEARFGIQEVADSTTFKTRLTELLMSSAFKPDSSSSKPAAKLYTLIPRGATAEIERETHFIAMVKQTAPHVQVVDVSPVIAELRKIKSPAEIEMLQRAIDITGEAQREAMRAIKPGAFEYEAQAALEAAFTRN